MTTTTNKDTAKTPATKKTPARSPKFTPSVVTDAQESTKADTFAAFLEKQNEASKWVTLGEFVDEHDLGLDKNMKVTVAKHLKNELGLESKQVKGNPQKFNRDDLETFFQITKGK